MKIEKYKGKNLFYYYYIIDSKTNIGIHHSLYSCECWWGVGYFYHGIQKGFYLRNKKLL